MVQLDKVVLADIRASQVIAEQVDLVELQGLAESQVGQASQVLAVIVALADGVAHQVLAEAVLVVGQVNQDSQVIQVLQIQVTQGIAVLVVNQGSQEFQVIAVCQDLAVIVEFQGLAVIVAYQDGVV